MRTDNKFNKFCKNPGDLYDPGAIIFGAGHEGCEVDEENQEYLRLTGDFCDTGWTIKGYDQVI
jgi:hypothetical protein